MSRKKHKQKRKCKRGKKVRLPVDKNGTPINIGDWIKFDDGILRVASLTVYGDGGWSIETDEDEYADNPGGGVVIPHDWWGKL